MKSDYFEPGETVTCQLVVTDVDGTATTPDTTKTCTITDSQGTEKVAAGAMSASAVGTIYYDYNIPPAAVPGTFTVKYILVHGTRTIIQHDYFTVREVNT